MMAAYVVLTLCVVVYLIFPIRKEKITFDEKQEVIQVYREQVAYLDQQYQKGLIDQEEKDALLKEVDRKSVVSMRSIEEKTYHYQKPFKLWLILMVGLILGAGGYGVFYVEQKVHIWHQHAQQYQDRIVEGLFDKQVMKETLKSSSQDSKDSYCFLLQQELLKHYSDSPDAWVSVGQCHLEQGFALQADAAVKRALLLDPNHLGANYFYADLEFLKQQRLSTRTYSRLSSLFRQHPEAVDIGYLLLLNSFFQGRFEEALFYIRHLKPHLEAYPKLKQAIEKLEKQMEDDFKNADWTGEGHHGQVSAVWEQDQTEGLSSSKNADLEKGMAFHDLVHSEVHSSAVIEEKRDDALSDVSHQTMPVTLMADIEIDPVLRAQAKTGNTLFVIVKSKDGQLVCVGRFSMEAHNEPLRVQISDTDQGIMKMLPMSDFKELELVARVSFSGDVIAQSGDLTSKPVLIQVAQKSGVHILIDEVVK